MIAPAPSSRYAGVEEPFGTRTPALSGQPAGARLRAPTARYSLRGDPDRSFGTTVEVAEADGCAPVLQGDRSPTSPFAGRSPGRGAHARR